MAIDVETQRRMENWARWRADKGSSAGFIGMTNAYELEGRGRRAEMSIPLLNGEAMAVDQAVARLPHELKPVVEWYWLEKGTSRQKAAKCRCSPATFYSRLRQAHLRIAAHLSEQRRLQNARNRPSWCGSMVVKPSC